MIVIGVVGGVASGKSLVSSQFEKMGAVRLDADAIGHEVLHDPEIKREIRSRWGDEVFTPTGEVDRAAMAGIVFGPPPQGPQELAYLEQLTHPRIEARLQSRREELSARGDTPAVVIDAALIFEAGWDKFCDRIVFVESPRSLRLARAQERGWSEAEFQAREAAQSPLDVKRSRCDFTIDNSQSPENTLSQTQQCWRRLV